MMGVTHVAHEHTFDLAADRERVWRALTSRAELEAWFAEHADVSPTVGGAYRFWGRHTLGTPTAAEARQTITACEPGRLLAYHWRIGSVPTDVTLRLEPSLTDPARTSLTVRHEVGGVIAPVRAREMVDDLWRLAVGNLVAHLAGGSGILRPDFGDPAPEIKLSIVIDAPLEAVWQALLDPETLNRWIASAAEVDPRPGGRYAFGWQYDLDGRQVIGGPTTILDMVPLERLVLDWPDWRGDPAVPKQTITWTLAPEAGRTRVTLVHGGFSRPADVSDYPFGWGWFLGRLREAVEGDPGTRTVR